ncbi:MAG: response regulator transcription factor [Gloeomargarita sp. HHBFW_bins_162]
MSLLLVEDDLELAEPLTVLLSQQGYQVTPVQDGETAYTLAKQNNYELLILDWMLPRLDGLTLCQRLRREGLTTPVLFLTARDGLTDRVQGLDAGADDYLVKPFAFAELAARVRALLRRPTGTTPTRLQVGDLVLEPEQRLAYRGNRQIVLSEKETQLLVLLMQHPGQILSHAHLLASLWPGELPADRNVLAAQVRLLRRKLEPPPLIQTVYGRGYGLMHIGADGV